MDDITLVCGCFITYEAVHDDGCKCPDCNGIQKGGGEWSMSEPCEEHAPDKMSTVECFMCQRTLTEEEASRRSAPGVYNQACQKCLDAARKRAAEGAD